MVRSDERAPVGYVRKLVYHPKTALDLPTFQHGRMTKEKIGSTVVGVPAVPIRMPIQDASAAAETAAQEAARQRKLREARIAGISAAGLEETLKPKKEQPWVTEASVRDAESLRAKAAAEERRARIQARRDKMKKFKAVGYDLDPVSDDDGRPDDELFTGDRGFETVDPLEVQAPSVCVCVCTS